MAEDKIAMILGGMKPREDMTEEMDSEEMALESACEDILLAVENKDAQLLCSALKDFVSVFQGEGE